MAGRGVSSQLYSGVVQEGQPEVSPVGKAQKLQLTIIPSLSLSLSHAGEETAGTQSEGNHGNSKHPPHTQTQTHTDSLYYTYSI